MQTNAATTGDNEVAGNDLGPLAWVLEELKKSLDGATKAIRRFVRDAELARGSDLAELDASQLRIARQQLHQAVGALEMVGFSAPAKVMRAMEALAQKFAQRPELCSDDAAVKVERAGFALAEYLEGVLKGKTASSVALFPQYRDVMDLVGGERVHPADLWSIDWAWVDAALPVNVTPAAYDPKVRTLLDQSVLKVVKTGDAGAAMALRDACLALAAGQSVLNQRVFWKICAAFFEATAKGLCATDVYAKRAASRVLLQYATLARGDTSVSDRLAQDLLFFCAQAIPTRASDAPVLSAVRHAYRLDQAKPFDYETPQFGRFDPAVLVQARKRIASATETWSALAGGDTNRLKVITDQFNAVGDSILKLHPESGELARALGRAVEVTVRSGEPPTTPIAMEVATAVLYLEAAYEDMDPTDSQMGLRSKALAQRLEHVIAGGQPEPLEGWMKDLYRRVSDRQTMGSVVDELRTTLGEVEKSLDQFFRQPQDKLPLHEVPSQLAQMRGVFSVLGLDQASLAALRMRDSVEKFLVDDGVASGARSLVIEKLGSSLGALGFLIDMLSYQRVLAKKLFVYDEVAGEFRPVMDPEKKAAVVPVKVLAPAIDVPTGAPVLAPVMAPIAPFAAASEFVPALAPVSAFGPVSSPMPLPMSMPVPLAVIDPVVAAVVPVVAVAEAAMPALAARPQDMDDDESEIRDIFLDEAREVVQNGLAAVAALTVDTAGFAEQTTLRRAFHTLKGSSRMVGLNEFGEAAWSMEQLLNSWLAEQKPASEGLITLSNNALTGFGSWVEDIAAGTDAKWSAPAFRQSADGLRVDKQLIALRLPDSVGGSFVPAMSELPMDFADLPFDLDLEMPAQAAPPEISVPLSPSRPEYETTGFSEDVREAQDSIVPDFVATETFDPLVIQGFGSAVPGEPESSLTLDLSDLGGDDFDFSGASREPEFQATGFSVGFEAEPAPSPLSLAQPHPGQIDPAFAQVAPLQDMAAGFVEHGVLPPFEAVVPDFEVSGTGSGDGREVPDEREDPVKIIGPLRIGIPLYNVYLNEADEWSRRLLTELSEWAMELHRPVTDSTVALAHSLAGSSATVGFIALSDIARALEQALQHVQLHGRGDEHHAQVFSYAAEDIRRLLHQFAAGFLKEPDAQILDALKTISQTDFATSAPDALHEPAAPLYEEVQAFNQPEFISQPDVVSQPEYVHQAEFVTQPHVASAYVAEPYNAPTLPAATLDIAAAPLLIDDHDDDIDLTDALDADLFPIFEEEALELMPRLGSALRQWSARPDNLQARNEVLRVLHTLKGSARLAGGMRLGEMTHRLESVIEQLGSESLQSAQLEPLLARFDALQSNFEALRAGPVQAMVLPEAVNLQAASAFVAKPANADYVSIPLATGLAAGSANVSDTARKPRAVQATTALAPLRQMANASVRVRSQLLDRLVNQAGEVMITRSRLASRLGQLKGSLTDLTGNLDRLRGQLRDIEVQSESQMQSRMALAKDSALDFDPLEFDRFTRVQELTRMMAESVNDVATVQRSLQRAVEGTEDDLIAQGRQARELQRDLLRTRMVEFEGISDRLYGVVRQAAKDAGKQVRLDITGGSMDIDRGVLERMAPAFEHLLRNSVAHGIEDPQMRINAGKQAAGSITINLQHQSNEVSVEFSDDGAGLDLQRIRDKAVSSGVAPNAYAMTDAEVSDLIFAPGFTTATGVTELAGRGIGMDVVRSEVNALGGRIETSTERGLGTRFKLVLPLTTAVTQVVMLRLGELVIGVAANVIEIVRRAPAADLETAYRTGEFTHAGEQVPFFWAGALLQASSHSEEATAKNLPVAVFRSAGQRVAVHVDEVLGNQEVVVKNLGPQLSRLPGLTGMSVLASGAVVLIYNPVALASVYGVQAGALRLTGQAAFAQGRSAQAGTAGSALLTGAAQVPLVMVVDDSITVRRVTQRLLKREGYRVVLAADGLQALERLQDEKPTVVLSDIEMPRMDGFDLARNIRADAKLRDLPIIMITSRIAEKHREHARELGVDHYLGKPYSEDELMGLVRHYCSAVVETA